MIKDKSDLHLSTLESANREAKRKDLASKADMYLANLKEQVGDVKSFGKNALIISGVILTTYFVVDSLLDDDEPTNTQPGGDSLLGSLLRGMATTALLALAKDQLLKIIDKENIHSEEAN